MNRHQTFLMCGLLSFVILGSSQAKGLEYIIDSTNSSVIFKVKNRGISYVMGRFNKISGVISANSLRNPNTFKVTVEVATKSLDTGDNKRDNHVRGKQFLNFKKNPTISFTTTLATRVDDKNKFELTGKLNFFGTIKEITVQCELVGMKEIDSFIRRVGIFATFTIKRSEFGMEYMIPEIDDEVTIIVNLEAELKVRPAG